MNAKRTTRFIAGISLILMMLLSACGAQSAPAAVPTLTISEMQTLVLAAAQPDCPAFSSETGQPLISSGDAGCFYYEPPAAGNPPTSTLPAAAAPAIQPVGNDNPPAAFCKEQMMGPFQPPQNDYWYIQVTNEDFPDDDELFSISWTKNITLSEWLVQDGNTTTEIVGVVRGSIQEVQFYHPTSGVYWRLCAHPDVQLANEIQLHAESIAVERNWLKVYNVGDLWMSLQTGDPELIALIKCITPSTQGIPSCQTP